MATVESEVRKFNRRSVHLGDEIIYGREPREIMAIRKDGDDYTISFGFGEEIVLNEGSPYKVPVKDDSQES